MAYRTKRLLILIALLLTSAAVLLMDPGDPILTETHWQRLMSEGPRPCSPVRPNRIRWAIKLGGIPLEADEKLDAWIRHTVGDTCRSDCALSVTARLDIIALDRPHFLNGAGGMQARIDLVRAGRACRDRRVYGVMIDIDQGRRGSRERQAQEVSRLIGSALRRHATSPRSEFVP